MTSPLARALRHPVRHLGWLPGLFLVLAMAYGPAAHAQKPFESAEAAMNAFGDAVARQDDTAMKALLGNDFRQLIPPVGAEVRQRFLEQWQVAHALQPVDDSHARIAVGNDGWTLPVPLVKGAKGWQFDTRAGVEEMRIRRVGRNELAVMQTMLAIYDAQNEYAQTDHDGDGVLVYAGQLASTAGKRDGLYYPTRDGEPASPLGAAFLTAGKGKDGQGYYGYHYKLLTAQGPHAPGGAYNYVVNGKLFGGFAVLAWPVKYGDTGVQSFMVSHDGQLFERDLGPDSAAQAAKIRSFDPGPGWSRVTP
ncbi:conserved exported hypothetical protein [Cupriavidus phytorum]|uniref:DUF2950 domain-containing protein n=2 Tax=Cupriavidus TaxID=106589 RepID=A0A975XJ30_9BURK|nr:MULTISPECIES: DUF2950 domain-containing protein [Cupriavidus]PZX34141.1 hypothetical protein C7416_101424 [Cupriavidus alkaliphilus]SOY71978.1 conserved exported hypothetical protein [Cupriavidus taiwanensis]